MQAKQLLLFSFVYPPVYVIMFKRFHHVVNIKGLTYLFLLFRRETVFFFCSLQTLRIIENTLKRRKPLDFVFRTEPSRLILFPLLLLKIAGSW